jgi:hypothetical protein
VDPVSVVSTAPLIGFLALVLFWQQRWSLALILSCHWIIISSEKAVDFCFGVNFLGESWFCF